MFATVWRNKIGNAVVETTTPSTSGPVWPDLVHTDSTWIRTSPGSKLCTKMIWRSERSIFVAKRRDPSSVAGSNCSGEFVIVIEVQTTYRMENSPYLQCALTKLLKFSDPSNVANL